MRAVRRFPPPLPAETIAAIYRHLVANAHFTMRRCAGAGRNPEGSSLGQTLALTLSARIDKAVRQWRLKRANCLAPSASEWFMAATSTAVCDCDDPWGWKSIVRTKTFVVICAVWAAASEPVGSARLRLRLRRGKRATS
jgi:hypothetical protein